MVVTVAISPTLQQTIRKKPLPTGTATVEVKIEITCRFCGVPIPAARQQRCGSSVQAHCAACSHMPKTFKQAVKRCADCDCTNPACGWALPFQDRQQVRYSNGAVAEVDTLVWLCENCYQERCDYYALRDWLLSKKAA
jgi:hypothetical protein